MWLAKKNQNVNLVLNQLKKFSAWSRNRSYYGPKGLKSQILTFSQIKNKNKIPTNFLTIKAFQR